MADIHFNLEQVASHMGISERQLRRKLKAMTGYSPIVYLKEIRLQLARKHLEDRLHTSVSKVASAVGFVDVVYFSRLYKERFGVLPKKYFLR